LLAADQPAAAAEEFNISLQRSPNNDKLHNSLGIALARQGQLDAAGQEFERAIQLNPQFPWPRLNNGVVLQQKGLVSAALTNYTKAVELQPEWGEALDNLAFLLATCPDAGSRDPRRAIAVSTKANNLVNRQSPHFLRTLAISYAADGQFTNAVSTAELAWRWARFGKFDALATNLQKDLENYRAGKTAAVDWKIPPESIMIRR